MRASTRGKPRNAVVERYLPGTNDEEEDAPRQHAPVRSRRVKHWPDTVLGQHRDLGGPNGNGDVAYQRDRGQPRKEAEDQQGATQDFKSAHKRS